MGIKNYLIEGVSCSGKTSVCEELMSRGYHVIHGDRELAYWGDLKTGRLLNESSGEQPAWIWELEKVKALVSDQKHDITFICGSSRNAEQYIDLFEEVFLLELDWETLNKRLAARPNTEWSGSATEGASFARMQHKTKEGLPQHAIVVDATAPLGRVVDTILKHIREGSSKNA